MFKILRALLDIWSAMRDYMWKAESDIRSNMRSVDGDQELAELEQEEQEKKTLEMDMENVLSEELFPAEDLNQTLREQNSRIRDNRKWKKYCNLIGVR